MHSLPEHYIEVCYKNHAPAVLSLGIKTKRFPYSLNYSEILKQKTAFNLSVFDPKHVTKRTVYSVSYQALNWAVRFKDGSRGVPVCVWGGCDV